MGGSTHAGALRVCYCSDAEIPCVTANTGQTPIDTGTAVQLLQLYSTVLVYSSAQAFEYHFYIVVLVAY
jgi:hypothetical protein